MNLEPEIEELLCLKSLGMAGKDELNRLQVLLADSSVSSTVLQEFEDLLAESMAFSSMSSRPSLLLRERVMVSTDPVLPRVVTDTDGGILDISRAFSDLCGYTIEEIRGKKPGRFLQGPDTASEAVDQFREAIRNRESCFVSLLNYHKSGSPYWVEINMYPVFGRSGELEGFSATEKRVD